MWMEGGMRPMIFPDNDQYMPITTTMDHHHRHENPSPHPRITRPLFDDQSKLRDQNANQHVNSPCQTENLYLHKFSSQVLISAHIRLFCIKFLELKMLSNTTYIYISNY
jgi:hypothetical protein